MVIWICLPHIAATSSNGGSLFWVKTTKSVSNYKGSSHHLHQEVINISPPPCLPHHQQCSIVTVSSCMSLSPPKPFHSSNLEISELVGKLWVCEPQFIICSPHSLPSSSLHHQLRAKVVGLAPNPTSGHRVWNSCGLCFSQFVSLIQQKKKVQNLFKLSHFRWK